MSSSQTNLSSSNLPILIVVLALCCFVTILLVVLLIMCLKYRSKTRGPAPLKLTMSKSEAAKLYAVESSRPDSGEVALSIPPSTQGVTVSTIVPLSRDVVIGMESNPLYHQLRTDSTNSNGGIERMGSPLANETNIISPPHLSSSSMIVPPTIITVEQTDDVFVRKSHSVSSSQKVYPKNGKIFNHLSPNEDPFIRTLSDTHIAIKRAESGDTSGPIYNQVQSAHSTKALSIVEIKPSNITTMGTLGMGQFGQVHLGCTHDLSATELGLGEGDFDRTKSYEVAVKFLNENATQRDVKAFQKEVKYMSQLRHSNVIQILAVCLEGTNFVVLEYMKNGDLQSFLQHYKTVNMGRETYNTTLSYHRLVNMALQISDAMRFLSSKNFIHRDLACRNCLVGEDFIVKVADFGLSKNLYDSCYYRFRGSALLPIRWMAPESFSGRFSEKTDVWSFGVTLWEIFNLCKERPYHQLSDQEIVQKVLTQTLPLLSKPECCTLQVHAIIQSCLKFDPSERENFESIHTQLLQIDSSL